MANWGPTHQRSGRAFSGRRAWRLVSLAVTIAILVVGSTAGPQASNDIFGLLIILIVISAIVWIVHRVTGVLGRLPRPHLRSRTGRSGRGGADGLVAVRELGLRYGGGPYLGWGQEGKARHARSQRAVLVLGPPRSGKTSAVIIPAVIAHVGPVVSTSTKPDVALATSPVRARDGQLWNFDPTGHSGAVPGTQQLRWSPVAGSTEWDDALLMARSMTTSIGHGTTDRTHWSNRAQALLAPLLHAAAVHERDMSDVVAWVMRHDLDHAGMLLEDERCAEQAFHSLLGLKNTEERERSSIFSAAADALQAYQSTHALAASTDPNFDADAFVRSRSTIYIHAPAEHQAAAAPLVCGLLSEIRRATYRAHPTGQTAAVGPMLFALDEAANIAPLEELPQIASEGGGQGLLLLASLQDLSQARHRWGQQADGFLTLFGTKLFLPGLGDTKTLEAVSTMLGEFDRQVVSHNTPQTSLAAAILSPSTAPRPHRSTTVSTQRTRVLSPGDIAKLPAGQALHLDGTLWERLTLTPAHRDQPWRTLTQPADPTT